MKKNYTEDGYKRMIEASKRGAETQRRKSQEKYNNNPRYCLNCGNIIPWEKRYNRFCNKSCSASYNNKQRAKKYGNCWYCGKVLERSQKRCCCSSCRSEYNYFRYIQKWKNKEVSGMSGEGVSAYIRRYLFEKNDNKCEKCGWSEKNPYTGNIPLTIHHIDGNHRNQKEYNLQLLCPNCHSLTESYGSRNKGNGREKRKAWRSILREREETNII